MIPQIGKWYKSDNSARFEVVAYDEEDGTVDIQYVDGAVEEIFIEDWDELKEEPGFGTCDAPMEATFDDYGDEEDEELDDDVETL